MITNVKIKNFKSLVSADVNLSKLTIFTGLNNSGKSSFLQAIRMGFQSSGNSYIEGYGGFKELKSANSIDTEINILMMGNNKRIKVSLSETKQEIIRERIPVLEYIAADRFGPSVILPIMQKNIDKLTVGTKGEFSVDYFVKFEDVLLHKNLLKSESISSILKHQLKHWMANISPGIDLSFSVIDKRDISFLDVDGFRATNVGFGISYALPIVLSSLVMTSEEPIVSFDNSLLLNWMKRIKKDGGMLLVENPEAHLHPKGQTAMGELLAMAAASDLQIIVETHSDHFIDGVRLAVKEKDFIKKEDVAIKFFEKDQEGKTNIVDINIRDDGRLDYWPLGFFDQSSINLRRLAKK